MEEDAIAPETQERQIKMLDQLQGMARDIPTEFQEHLPFDLLSALSLALLDDTIFEIMRELAELQHLTEKSLHQQRLALVKRHRGERDEMARGHREEVLAAERQGKTHVAKGLPALQREQLAQLGARQAQETRACHLHVLKLLDQKVTEQQSTLRKAGVPGFYETDSPKELKVQMFIMGFIVRIGGIQVPSLEPHA